MNEFNKYENLTQFREPLIRKMMESVSISPGSRGIDIGCGIGRVLRLLCTTKGIKNELTGLDYSASMIDYARNQTVQSNINYIQGDVNSLDFEADSFDWIWSMDTIWAGPAAYGCPAEEPGSIMNSLYNILKPDGRLYLSFWTSQKLLPGYPLLEARLNSSITANRPYINGMNPQNHVLWCKKWLKKAKFSEIQIKTFAGDIAAPLSKEDKAALAMLFDMLWGNSKDEVSPDDWNKFQELCSPASPNFLPHDPDYYGFYTYTLFQGKKQ